MNYSKLIYAGSKNHYEIAEKVIKEECTDSEHQKIMIYAPCNTAISTEIAARAKVIQAQKVMFKDILSIILSFDTLRASDILDNVPSDVVIVVPDCDRYLKFVAVELIQSVLNQLVYMGVRLIFISNANEEEDCVVNELQFEEVQKA